MNNEQLKQLLAIAEDASKQSPAPRIHIDAETCAQLVRQALEEFIVVHRGESRSMKWYPVTHDEFIEDTADGSKILSVTPKPEFPGDVQTN